MKQCPNLCKRQNVFVSLTEVPGKSNIEVNMFSCIRYWFFFLYNQNIYSFSFIWPFLFLGRTLLETRLRHNCILNEDLFRWTIINNSLCSYGKIENTYLFSSSKYSAHRNELCNVIFNNLQILNTSILLWGDSISPPENENLFSKVLLFIKKSIL